jgi:predicted peptidase
MNPFLKNIRTLPVALATLAALSLPAAPAVAQPGQGRGMYDIDARAEERSYRFEQAGMDMPYCVYASSKVSADTAAPLIIALHGAGTGPQIMCNTTIVDLAEARGYIVAAPMGYNERGGYGAPRRAGRGGANAAAAPEPANVPELSEQDVMNVLAMMREEFNVDDNRIYLMGHSMGGGGTMYLGPKHADIWAAIAPIAGGGGQPGQAESLQRLKAAGVAVIVVHGDADEIVPVQGSRDLAALLQEVGVESRYVELPGVGHGPVINLAQQHIFDFFDGHSR